MRIAFDGRYITDHYPGVGRYAYNLVKALADGWPQHSFLVLAPTAGNSRYVLEALAVLPNVTLTTVGGPHGQWKAARAVNRWHADVLHRPHFGLALLARCPAVVTLHDLTPLAVPETMPSLLARSVFRTLVQLSARGSAVITGSQAAADELLRLPIQARELTVVPHGVEARFQPPSRQQTAALADQLGLRQPYFLHMGTNKPHKNIANLVAAWEQLPEVLRRRYSLVFGGTPDVRYPTAAALAAQYGVSESVHELGAIAEADLPALYGGASGFIFPSLAEGFGLPVLEAMACGCPVACSNVSSLPEVSGEAALLFDPYNASAIARSLLLLAEKPELRSTLRQAGLEHAARYTWQTAATATLAVYQRAIQPRQEV